MNVEAKLSFVDTNVLVYCFESSDSRKKHLAQQLLIQLMDDNLLRVSTQVLQELFVTLTKKVSQRCSSQEALTLLDELAAWPVMVIDYAAVSSAVSLSANTEISFWDALAVVAAAQSGAAVLYTEDLNDGQEILGVRISNPFKS